MDAGTRVSVHFPHVVLTLTNLSRFVLTLPLAPFSRRSSVTMMEKLTLAVVGVCVLRMSSSFYLNFLVLLRSTIRVLTERALPSPSLP